MNRTKAVQVLNEQEQKGRYIFSTDDLRKLFPEDSEQTFNQGTIRLVNSGILKRACRGVYVNEQSKHFDSYTIERIVKTLRRGEYNYISLESVLSQQGVISQIPLDRLTVMTTGRKGVYKTAYGIIEFTHTKRAVKNILQNTIKAAQHPLRIATKNTALRDIKRVGRNINLMTVGQQ